MLTQKSLVFAAILAAGVLPLQAVSVGYYTDYNTSDTGPAAPITANSLTPVQITTLATFNLSTIKILMIDESANGSPSADFLSAATAISNWVAAGGIVAIHDRNVCAGTCTPVPGSSGITFTRLPGAIINVETAGNKVTNGSFGTITNSNLSGGNSSDHGYAGYATLPAGSTAFLNNGTPGHEVSFAYRFGSGWVYYSTIPLDFYLDGSGSVPAFKAIYAPNMISYLNGLVTGVSVPTLSEWGLGTLALLLMGWAVLRLKSSPSEKNAG